MAKLSTVIIDDELHAVEALALQIEKNCLEVVIQKKFTNPQEGLSYLQNTPVDVLFLDIEMPRMNGFSLLSHWQTPPFKVVFTTAYDEFAVQAFKVSAFDYLLKPIEREVLMKTIEKLQRHGQNESTHWEQLQLLQNLINHQQASNTKVALPVGDGFVFVYTNEVVRCEGDTGYTQVFLANEKPILISKTLKEVEHTLFSKAGFMRVHQSHLVNPKYLKKYVKKDGGYLLLDDGTQVPLSRRKKDDFLEQIARKESNRSHKNSD
jgi:two-component system LytT family response regulator